MFACYFLIQGIKKKKKGKENVREKENEQEKLDTEKCQSCFNWKPQILNKLLLEKYVYIGR